MVSIPKPISKLFKGGLSKNSSFLLLVFLSLFLFLLWPSPALGGALINAISSLPYLLIGVMLLIVVIISWAFAWLSGFILDWVLSPDFISLSYTNPAGNQVIDIGLNITLSLVNLIIVAALVYLAISLALRYQETQTKQALFRLIAVALLVNFAPVFCGVVVDACNITMNYFLEPIREGVSGALTQMKGFVDKVKLVLKNSLSSVQEKMGILMMIVTQIVLNYTLGVAFLLFAMIFLLRYIAIWILVILAPIAFAAWIFPTGSIRKVWDLWFKQFIQWSIIGIPMAFFLYLAVGTFEIMTAAFKMKMEMPGVGVQTIGYFNQIFPYFVVMSFLWLGFVLGLQTGAMGSTAIIGGFKSAHKTAGQKLASRGARGIGRAAWLGTAGAAGAVGALGVAAAKGKRGRIGRTYRAGKALGLSPPRALGVAIGRHAKRGWRKGIRKAEATRETTKKAAKKAAKIPVVATCWEVAKAGVKAGFKAPKEKKVDCPSCGKTVPDKKFCNECGTEL